MNVVNRCSKGLSSHVSVQKPCKPFNKLLFFPLGALYHQTKQGGDRFQILDSRIAFPQGKQNYYSSWIQIPEDNIPISMNRVHCSMFNILRHITYLRVYNSNYSDRAGKNHLSILGFFSPLRPSLYRHTRRPGRGHPHRTSSGRQTSDKALLTVEPQVPAACGEELWPSGHPACQSALQDRRR